MSINTNGRVPIQRNMHRRILVMILLISEIILTSYIILQNRIYGYELSIYTTAMWELYFSTISGIFLILYLLLVLGSDTLDILSFVTILGCAIVFHALIIMSPQIFGYFVWNADSTTHMGQSIDIIQLQRIPGDDFYPILHILTAVTYLLSHITLYILSPIMSLMFYTLFVLSVYLLHNHIETSFSSLLSLLIPWIIFPLGAYEINYTPNGSSMFYIFYIYFVAMLLFKKDERRFIILYLLSLLILPLFHPLSTLIFILLMTIYSTTEIRSTKMSHYLIFTYFIIGSIFTLWIFRFNVYTTKIQFIYDILFRSKSAHYSTNNNEMPIFKKILSLITIKLGLTKKGALYLLAKLFADKAILSVLGSYWAYVFLVRPKGHRLTPQWYKDLIKTITIETIVLLGAYILIMFSKEFSEIGSTLVFERILFYIYALILVLNVIGIKLNEIVLRKHSRIFSIVIIIIFVVSILEFASLFYSPYLGVPSPISTKTDIMEFKWYLQKKTPKIVGYTDFYRLFDILTGYHKAQPKYGITLRQHGKFGNIKLLQCEGYILITSMDTHKWKLKGYHSDISKETFLNLAKYSNKIYDTSNGGGNIWLNQRKKP